MTRARDDRQADQRLVELRRAAYRRDASDEDRAALAEYERARPAPSAVAPGEAASRRPFPRRVVTAAVLGAAVGAGCVAWAAGLFEGDAFDRFTAPVADPLALAETSASLAAISRIPGMVSVGGDAVIGSLLAGPVPLHSSHGVDLSAALAVSADGEQHVCIVEVRGERAATTVCVPRPQFEDEGIAHRFARDEELNAILEIVWRADDSVMIREADLSAIG